MVSDDHCTILKHSRSHQGSRISRLDAADCLTAVDAVPPAPSEAAIKAKYLHGDLKDYGQVIGLLGEVDSGYRGIDAVIHLAAIAAPARTVRRALTCPS